VNLAYLIGLYFVIQRVVGKGQVKVLTASLKSTFKASGQNFNLTFSRHSLNNKVQTNQVGQIHSQLPKLL
jgi:hypothetical protein